MAVICKKGKGPGRSRHSTGRCRQSRAVSRWVLTVAILFACVRMGALGQQPTDTGAQVGPAPLLVPALTEEDAKLITTLKALQTSIALFEAQAQKKRDELADETLALAPDEKEQRISEISDINKQLEDLRHNYEEFASGIDLSNLRHSGDSEVDLGADLREFLSPIVTELKDLTSRPREIEDLRRTISQEQKNRDNAEKALANVRRLLQQLQDKPGVEKVAEDLRIFEQTWQQRLNQISSDIDVAELQLNERLDASKSVWGTVRGIMASFFRSRGRNLMFALLAVATVLLLARLGYAALERWSPLRRMERRSFYVRVLDITYFAVAITVAVLAAMVVFYTAGDWVLLGLVLIFLAGLAWTGKHALPQTYEQVKLMLNLGPVREGERLVYDGVPWKVERIGLYTDLVNPSLEGGCIRLPIRTLASLHSRPFGHKETWFPCEQGNWVVLSDATFGRVITQTPDWVELVLLGGSRKTYTASDFVALNPENLSRNFRIHIMFGVDYSHQAISTTEIPELLRMHILTAIKESTLLKEDQMIHLAVEFCNAGASSLDYRILLDCQGTAAQNYNKLQRLLAKLCVEASNEHGWIIPFTQVTMHYADVQKAEVAARAIVMPGQDEDGEES